MRCASASTRRRCGAETRAAIGAWNAIGRALLRALPGDASLLGRDVGARQPAVDQERRRGHVRGLVAREEDARPARSRSPPRSGPSADARAAARPSRDRWRTAPAGAACSPAPGTVRSRARRGGRTRRPSRATSTSTAPLDAVYEICDTAAPITATNDAVLITDPPPASSRCGIPCLQHRNTLRTFTSCTRCHASSGRVEHRLVVGRVDPRVVPQDVDAAELRARALVHVAHLLLVGDVGLERQLALRAAAQVDAHDLRALPARTSAPPRRRSRSPYR